MLPLLTTESTKINDLCHNKLCFVCYCVWDHMPKLCFVMVLTSCKDFLQIVRIFCHDLTDRSCPRLTPLIWKEGRKEMFYLTTHSIHFYLQLYGDRHMVKDHSDSERGNPLPPHGLLFLISIKGSFICTIPQTG